MLLPQGYLSTVLFSNLTGLSLQHFTYSYVHCTCSALAWHSVNETNALHLVLVTVSPVLLCVSYERAGRVLQYQGSISKSKPICKIKLKQGRKERSIYQVSIFCIWIICSARCYLPLSAAAIVERKSSSMGSSQRQEEFRSIKAWTRREFIQDNKHSLEFGVLTSSAIEIIRLHPNTPIEGKKAKTRPST